jgi:hypothetical protein
MRQVVYAGRLQSNCTNLYGVGFFDGKSSRYTFIPT